jgi:hypothetical protein
MAIFRLHSRILCCVLPFALAGCTSLKLYDSTRDSQGQAAKKAWSEVDLQTMIAGERANLDRLLAAEIDTQNTLAAAVADYELKAMVDMPIQDGFSKMLSDRMASLTGGRDTRQAAADAIAKSQARIAMFKSNIASTGAQAPDCAKLAKGATPADLSTWLETHGGPAKAAVQSWVVELRRECANELKEDDFYATFGGAIGTAWGEYTKRAADLKALRAAAEVDQKNYQAARAAYDKALAGATAPQTDPQVRAAAIKLEEAISRLRASTNPYAVKLANEESIKAIDAIAQAITEANGDHAVPKDAGAAAATFVVLMQFRDEVNGALAASKKPLALPLLVRRNYEQLNLEAARRDIAATEKMVDLSHQLVVALYVQAQQLSLARAELDQDKRLYTKTLGDAIQNGAIPERQALYFATARYLDAVKRLDAQRYTLEYRRIAAQHEKALAYAEVNAKQWQSLIDTSVNQVAEYSASGFKPEQVANFMNTLGLFYIGVGTNK